MSINPYESPGKPTVPAPPPKSPARRFTRWHLYLFLVIWCGFTIWTFLIVNGGVDEGSDKRTKVIWTTALSILGPMTGAISRDWQSCCLKFSLSLLPYCSAFVLIGTFAQVVRFPFKRLAMFARMLLWTVGWIGWFMGGIVSFTHALS